MTITEATGSRSENITRAEASERSDLISTTSYEVVLDLTSSGPTFATTTTALFACTTPGAHTWIDLIAPKVESVTLNGIELPVAEVVQGARILLPNLEVTNTLVVVAQGKYMNTGEGLHRFVDPVDNETYLYTQFESADARRMYACFEQPDLKATFTLTATAPGNWKVISNSPMAQVTDNDNDNDTKTWEFEPTPTISTYITALVAGPYFEVSDEYVGPYGTYPLGIYCRQSLSEFLDPDEIFEVTKQGFTFFEDQFKVGYPFAKYDQLFVPEFNAGAMENAGCVTFLEDLIFRSRVTVAAYEQRANTILHELAHMWFGNLVTMTWWDDLWLNESFAEWAAHHANVHATRYNDAWTTFANLRKAWAYRQDQLPSTHPIAADMVDLDAVRVNFDGITYAKGASALRQLVAWVGEPEFMAGIGVYFNKHAWGNTQLSDLLTELEATSGRDLSEWTREWLQTSGVNLLRPLVTVDPEGNYESVIIEQEPPTSPIGVAPTLRSHRVGLGLYDLTDAGLVQREFIAVDVTGAQTQITRLVGKKQPDLLLVNDGDLTFAKVRLDDKSWKTATAHLGDISDSLARAVIWSAAWDMTRDAEASTGEFLELVLAGIERESDVGVTSGVLRQLSMAIDQFAAPAHRDEYRLRLAQACEKFATEAGAGSDHQLAFARVFVGNATTNAQLETVAGLLDATITWDGLKIDTDLRWTLLRTLVGSGIRGDVEIDAELEVDNTATGKRQATLALASRPTMNAKEAAWDAVMHNNNLPNTIIEATIGGFQDPDHRDLMEAFVDRYFAELPDVWEEQTMEMAQDITAGMYPVYATSPELITKTNEFLANSTMPTLIRLVTEGRDGAERALRAQAKDA
jgi:aminopeptidase N